MKTENTQHKSFDNNTVNTKEGKLILDSHKLSYHYDRVKAWENGERIAPSVLMLQQELVVLCVHFVAMVQEQKKDLQLKLKL